MFIGERKRLARVRLIVYNLELGNTAQSNQNCLIFFPQLLLSLLLILLLLLYIHNLQS